MDGSTGRHTDLSPPPLASAPAAFATAPPSAPPATPPAAALAAERCKAALDIEAALEAALPPARGMSYCAAVERCAAALRGRSFCVTKVTLVNLELRRLFREVILVKVRLTAPHSTPSEALMLIDYDTKNM
jgi:hypothetical protein